MASAAFAAAQKPSWIERCGKVMKNFDIPYSMPRLWPSYSEPPYLYRGVNILVCIYRAEAKAVKRAVPAPLKPCEGNLVYAWINECNVMGAGPYREAIIGIPVEFHGACGHFTAYHFVDNESVLAGGREIWGFPRKGAHFIFRRVADVITRAVVRGGDEILKISMQITGAGPADVLSALQKPIYNLKVIPSVRKGASPDVKQLTVTCLQDVVVHQLFEGKATVNFDISPRGFRHSLAPREIIGSFSCFTDFDLRYGNIVHDYLSP